MQTKQKDFNERRSSRAEKLPIAASLSQRTQATG